MAKGKGKTPTKKQLLSPKLDGMGFSNDEIMDVINKFIPTYELSSISAKFGSYY